MKVGPDSRLYVGTQSERRLGISEKLDGKLYSIDASGNVTILLDRISLSNGMEWSADESLFYHTDSDTSTIREYDFDPVHGKIVFTGRQITIPGADGFTIDKNDNLYVGCWGKGHIAVVDTKAMEISDFIDIPCNIPTSCCFCGSNADVLAVTTASINVDTAIGINAGYTFLYKTNTRGEKAILVWLNKMKKNFLTNTVLPLIPMILWGSLFPFVKIGYKAFSINTDNIGDILHTLFCVRSDRLRYCAACRCKA